MAEVPIEYFLTMQGIRLLSSLIDKTEPPGDILPEGMDNAALLSLIMSITAVAYLALECMGTDKRHAFLSELSNHAD